MKAILILFLFFGVSTALAKPELDLPGNLLGVVGGVSNAIPSIAGIKLPDIPAHVIFGVLYIIAKILTTSSDGTKQLANGINPDRLSIR